MIVAILTIALAEALPLPPGCVMPLQSPRAAEYKASLGVPMSRQTIVPTPLVSESGFRITNIALLNGTVALSWQTGSNLAPWQVLGASSLGNGWNTVGNTLVGTTVATFPISTNHFWKLQSSAPSHLWLNPTNQPRLTWDTPDIMADSLGNFLVQVRNNQPPVLQPISDDTGWSLLTTVVPPGPYLVNDSTSGERWYRVKQTTSNGVVIPYGVVGGNFAGSQVNGSTSWARIVNPTSSNVGYGNAIAIDPRNGEVVVFGYLTGTVDIGSPVGTITSVGSTDMMMVRYTAAGVPVSAVRYGGASTDVGNYLSAAIDINGNIYVAVALANAINLGGGNVTPVNHQDILLVKYNSSGAFVTQKHFNTAGSDFATAGTEEFPLALRTDGSGNVYMCGFFTGGCIYYPDTTISGGLNFIPGTTPSYPPPNTSPPPGFLCCYSAEDSYVVKFNSSLTHLWSKNWLNSTGAKDNANAVAIDPNGVSPGVDAVIVVGLYDSTIDFGGGELPLARNRDGYVAKIRGDNGEYIWAKGLGGGEQEDSITGCAVDSDHNVAICGRYQSGSFDTGCGVFTKNSISSNNGIVSKRRGADGTCLWAKTFATTIDNYASLIATDSAKNIVVICKTTASVPLAIIDSSGSTDLTLNVVPGFLVVKFSASGGIIWTRLFGGAGSSATPNGLQIDSSDNIYISGYQYGTVDWGNSNVLAGAGSGGAFTLKLNP